MWLRKSKLGHNRWPTYCILYFISFMHLGLAAINKTSINEDTQTLNRYKIFIFDLLAFPLDGLDGNRQNCETFGMAAMMVLDYFERLPIGSHKDFEKRKRLLGCIQDLIDSYVFCRYLNGPLVSTINTAKIIAGASSRSKRKFTIVGMAGKQPTKSLFQLTRKTDNANGPILYDVKIFSLSGIGEYTNVSLPKLINMVNMYQKAIKSNVEGIKDQSWLHLALLYLKAELNGQWLDIQRVLFSLKKVEQAVPFAAQDSSISDACKTIIGTTRDLISSKRNGKGWNEKIVEEVLGRLQRLAIQFETSNFTVVDLDKLLVPEPHSVNTLVLDGDKNESSKESHRKRQIREERDKEQEGKVKKHEINSIQISEANKPIKGPIEPEKKPEIEPEKLTENAQPPNIKAHETKAKILEKQTRYTGEKDIAEDYKNIENKLNEVSLQASPTSTNLANKTMDQLKKILVQSSSKEALEQHKELASTLSNLQASNLLKIKLLFENRKFEPTEALFKVIIRIFEVYIDLGYHSLVVDYMKEIKALFEEYWDAQIEQSRFLRPIYDFCRNETDVSPSEIAANLVLLMEKLYTSEEGKDRNTEKEEIAKALLSASKSSLEYFDLNSPNAKSGPYTRPIATNNRMEKDVIEQFIMNADLEENTHEQSKVPSEIFDKLTKAHGNNYSTLNIHKYNNFEEIEQEKSAEISISEMELTFKQAQNVKAEAMSEKLGKLESESTVAETNGQALADENAQKSSLIFNNLENNQTNASEHHVSKSKETSILEPDGLGNEETSISVHDGSESKQNNDSEHGDSESEETTTSKHNGTNNEDERVPNFEDKATLNDTYEITTDSDDETTDNDDKTTIDDNEKTTKDNTDKATKANDGEASTYNDEASTDNDEVSTDNDDETVDSDDEATDSDND